MVKKRPKIRIIFDIVAIIIFVAMIYNCIVSTTILSGFIQFLLCGLFCICMFNGILIYYFEHKPTEEDNFNYVEIGELEQYIIENTEQPEVEEKEITDFNKYVNDLITMLYE